MRRLSALVAIGLCLVALGRAEAASAALSPLEVGIDRSNMAAEWSLAPPAEPDVYPFSAPPKQPGVFEARRKAVFDGIAALHPQWFRDGIGDDNQAGYDLLADLISQMHARGIKVLVVMGASAGDFDPRNVIARNADNNGCSWVTESFARIDQAKFEHRLRGYFDTLKRQNISPDAFEIGNELDSHCNDADMPTNAEFAAHQWKWFLNDAQVSKFADGYAPFLEKAVDLIKEYFPHAQIITFGMANPTGNSAPLIKATMQILNGAIDRNGRPYANDIDGYGTHVYPPGDTTQHMVQTAVANLLKQAVDLPDLGHKSIWVTEWSESNGAMWGSSHWWFQYNADGAPGGEMNLAQSPYPAMTREAAVRVFNRDVIDRLRMQAAPVDISHIFYYAYDGEAQSKMCDHIAFNVSRGLRGVCYFGLIDPITGQALPNMGAAVAGR